MRYYAIKIAYPDGKLFVTPSSVAGTEYTYTSFANNVSLPGALLVELDVPLAGYATPAGAAFVRIWGVSLEEIAAATQLNPTTGSDGNREYKSIAVYGGMAKGLPLANAAQQGLLVEGVIWQAFGNWVGTEQNLDLIIFPEFGSNNLPKNISLDWKSRTSFADAIKTTLSTAFPKYTANIQISSDIVLSNDEPGYYRTIEQFANYVKRVSRSIIGGDYQGVDIFLSNGVLNVLDGTTQTTPKKIEFQDLIGQPTWIEGPSIQLKCVMRGDIQPLDFITMPQALIVTTAGAASSLVNLNATFKGTFRVQQVRHIGNSRQPDAASWVTVIDAFPTAIKTSGDLTVNPSAFQSNLNFN